MATDREKLRTHLFKELIPLPRREWPDDETNLFGLGLDSIRVMRLLAFIEDELGVRIPETSIVPENLGNVSALVQLIDASSQRR
jgi:acyl carrier protein